MQSSYRCARIFVSAIGHSTCIQDNNFGIVGGDSALQSPFQKLLFHGGAIGLCSAAAKIFYVEASHAPILNE